MGQNTLFVPMIPHLPKTQNEMVAIISIIRQWFREGDKVSVSDIDSYNDNKLVDYFVCFLTKCELYLNRLF